jgi:hypothetical protein
MCWKNPLPPGFEKISADIMREKQYENGNRKKNKCEKSKERYREIYNSKGKSLSNEGERMTETMNE